MMRSAVLLRGCVTAAVMLQLLVLPAAGVTPGCLKQLVNTDYELLAGPVIQKGKTYSTDAGTTVTMASQADCCTACTATLGCLIFRYNTKTGTCTLGTFMEPEYFLEMYDTPFQSSGFAYMWPYQSKPNQPGINVGFPTAVYYPTQAPPSSTLRSMWSWLNPYQNVTTATTYQECAAACVTSAPTCAGWTWRRYQYIPDWAGDTSPSTLPVGCTLHKKPMDKTPSGRSQTFDPFSVSGMVTKSTVGTAPAAPECRKAQYDLKLLTEPCATSKLIVTIPKCAAVTVLQQPRWRSSCNTADTECYAEVLYVEEADIWNKYKGQYRGWVKTNRCSVRPDGTPMFLLPCNASTAACPAKFETRTLSRYAPAQRLYTEPCSTAPKVAGAALVAPCQPFEYQTGTKQPASCAADTTNCWGLVRYNGKSGWMPLASKPYGGDCSNARELTVGNGTCPDDLPTVRFTPINTTVTIYNNPSTSAKALGTAPTCKPFFVYTDSERGSLASTPGKECWTKVSVPGGRSGWMVKSMGTNPEDPCGDVDKDSNDKKLENAKPYYQCETGDACGDVRFEQGGDYMSDIIGTARLQQPQDCCYQCGLNPRCKAFSHNWVTKVCKMTNNTWQVPDPTVPNAEDISVGSNPIWGFAYVMANAPPLPVWTFVEGRDDPQTGSWIQEHYTQSKTVKTACSRVQIKYTQQGPRYGFDMGNGELPAAGDCYVSIKLALGKEGYILKSSGGPNKDYPCWNPSDTYLALTLKDAGC